MIVINTGGVSVFMTIIKSIPLLNWCLSSSRYLCCIDDYHQVDTSAVFMTIIKSIPLLYLWLSSSRYLCCIHDYHQVDTSAVFMSIIKSIPLLYLWLSCVDLMIAINTAEVSTWWQASVQQRYGIDDSHQYSRGDHQVDTSAVFMSITKLISLLYLWLSSSRYLSCIYDYHQFDTSAVSMTKS
jgi:uncharacterized protein with HEPN domain